MIISIESTLSINSKVMYQFHLKRTAQTIMLTTNIYEKQRCRLVKIANNYKTIIVGNIILKCVLPSSILFF